MLKKGSVHYFSELRDRSIDDIISECKYDFARKCLEITKENKDNCPPNHSIFTIQAYQTFNGKGRYVTYQDKSVEYQSLETDMRQFFELYLKRLENNLNTVVPDSYSKEISDYLLQTVKNKTKEDLGLTLTKPEYKRYESLFGLGEFPFLMITIVRIGNKRYFFYQIER